MKGEFEFGEIDLNLTGLDDFMSETSLLRQEKPQLILEKRQKRKQKLSEPVSSTKVEINKSIKNMRKRGEESSQVDETAMNITTNSISADEYLKGQTDLKNFSKKNKLKTKRKLEDLNGESTSNSNAVDQPLICSENKGTQKKKKQQIQTESLPAEPITENALKRTLQNTERKVKKNKKLKNATKDTTAIEIVPGSKHGTRMNPERPVDLSQFHLKARDLSVGAADAPRSSNTSTHIFTDNGGQDRAAQGFESLGLHPKLVRVLTDSTTDAVYGKKGGFGLRQPTKVQAAAVPAILGGSDVFLKSETGSGKTLAYLLPLVHLLQARNPKVERSYGTYAIIIAPTRELCHQIEEVLADLVYPFVWLVPGAITGGERRKSEKARLRKGLTVLVATPGRLLDHLKLTQCFNKENLEWLILDEADRMFDLGFSKQLSEILEHLNKERQTIMVSATLSPEFSSFAKQFLKEFTLIDVDAPEKKNTDNSDEYVIPKQLQQHHMVVTQKLRLPALCTFLRQRARENHKVLVFFSTCDSVDFHTMLLQSSSWPNFAERSSQQDSDNTKVGMFGKGFGILKLHGSMSQPERAKAFATFFKINKGVLLCTDVAARGLDLPAVDWILQYDPPSDITDYVHRIGRTARKGAQGHALFFLLPSETEYLPVLSKHGLNPIALSLQATLLAEASARQRKRPNPEDLVALDVQSELEETVSANTDLRESGRKAFQAYVRAYATHSNEVKHVFKVRSLHLGHVAKSFALKDSPRAVKVGGIILSNKGNQRKQGTPGKKKKQVEKRGKVSGENRANAILNAEFM